MECSSNCWGIVSPPTIPPAPPIPPFLSPTILNASTNCDFCGWAGVHAGAESNTSSFDISGKIELSTLLVIVGLISAGIGAGIMAAILSIKRRRAFAHPSNSIRHLARKESSRLHHNRRGRGIGTSNDEVFPSSSFVENAYCDAPYACSNTEKDAALRNCSSNIYAELQEPREQLNIVWQRPQRLTATPVDNCYLELTDLQHRNSVHYLEPRRICRAVPPCLPTASAWLHQPLPLNSPSSSHYSDLEIGKNSVR